MGAVGNSWRADAACAREGETELFFHTVTEDEAKAVCASCPVREPCLNYALETRQELGVWGGMTERERAMHLLRVTPGGTELELTTYTTRARSTGTVCSAGRTSTGWGTFCETHGTRATARSRTAAEHAVSRPEEWCRTCARSLYEESSRKD